MKRYIIKRLLEMLPATFGVLVLAFLLFHVVGGSPAEIILGKNATAEALAAFDARFGYDKPLLIGRWTSLRALGEGVSPQTAAAAGTDRPLVALNLFYPLPEGTYRLPVDHLRIHLQSIATTETDDVLLDGPSPLVFSVAKGWKVQGLRVRPPLVGKLRLEKRNAHILDSQFVNSLVALLKGDLGLSTEYRLPVATVLRQGVGPSLCLTIPILAGGTVLGVMLALVCAAWRGGKTDQSILFFSTLLLSVNYVVWVLAGQFILAFRLHLFPLWGFESATYLILPILIGILSGLGRDIRFFRAVILDEIYKPYVRTAQAKGLGGAHIMLRHVLRNSLIPIITYVSLSIPFLFTGSLMLESFFGIPGLGSVSINALHSSDMAVVRAVVILGALFYQLINLLADLCCAWLDPRIRLG